jgi:putative spermidine/putrescine transport system ATP-binding protein
VSTTDPAERAAAERPAAERPAAELRGVSQVFGDFVAVDDIDLSIRRGR